MAVQYSAGTAHRHIDDDSIFGKMELNKEMYKNPFHLHGEEPLEFIRTVQQNLTNKVEWHTAGIPLTTVVYTETGSVTIGVIWDTIIGSSTLPTKIDEELNITLKSTLQLLEENLAINSEDSEVFYEFNTLFMKYKDNAIYLLQDLITGNEINSIFAGKLLKHLGYMANDFPTKVITWLLEIFLDSKKIAIRNSAVLGLAYINNPKTIPALEKALDVEPIPEIKGNIKQVLEQLINKE